MINDEINVVVSGKCITSRGVGTAIEFSIELIKKLYCEQKAIEIMKKIVFKK